MTILEQHKLFVRQDGETSVDPITPTAGVLQGDTVAPYIFILCMDIILQQLEDKWGAPIERDQDTDEQGRHVQHCSRNPVKRLSNLAYSNDVVLFSSSTEHAQLQFSRFEQMGVTTGRSLW